jgi:hypothetical protein
VSVGAAGALVDGAPGAVVTVNGKPFSVPALMVVAGEIVRSTESGTRTPSAGSRPAVLTDR